jgi:general L-amino acid transport system permease protein
MNSSANNLFRLIYNEKARNIFFQTVLLLVLLFGIFWIISNTITNLSSQGKSFGFGFLGQTAGFQISSTLGTWLMTYNVGSSTYLDVFLIGVINTFLVASLGIVFATVIGFLLGVMRLSSNVILRSFSAIYVEVLRNVPLLLQLFFWYFAVLRSVPDRRSQLEIIPGVAGLNIIGLYLPAPLIKAEFEVVFYAFLAATIGAYFFGRYAKKRQEQTGKRLPSFWIGAAFIFIMTAIAFVATDQPLDWSYPVFKDSGSMLRRGFQIGEGMTVVPEFIAVLFALSLYTAAFIAEIVRAGILAISKGQSEASYSLGLKPATTLRLVIIPQAMRVIIPPLTSQYLNLTKNSSLAVAIAYPELVSIFAGTALNQVGREIEMIAMMMAVYLSFSLLTAAFMNWFNARVKLVER